MARPKKETITGPIRGIGERIRKIVDEYYNGVESDFAEAVGRAASTINGYTAQGVIPDAEFFSIVSYRLGYEGTWLLTGLGPEKRKGYRNKKPVLQFSEADLTSYQEAEWFDLQELQNLRLEYMLKAAEIMDRQAERYRLLVENEKAEQRALKGERALKEDGEHKVKTIDERPS